MTVRPHLAIASLVLAFLPSLGLSAEKPKVTSKTSTQGPSPSNPSTAVASIPASSEGGTAATSPATKAQPPQKPKHAPIGVRHLPGKVIMGQVLSIDESGKNLRVRSLRGDEIDLSIGPKTEMQPGPPLAVGKTIRTRYDLIDGKLVPIFIRVLVSPDDKWQEIHGRGASAAAAPESAGTAAAQ